ncbi:endospore germination permease [Bacillus sp. 3255]|uniref:GerAB/ArcD/ProY family transporter n=1 Tax=Bacillus sp. 3255 TaxID=2817904 RepID=UPI0028591842|nr:endospore germination permease [Bacillus sp. 3255]MDR6882553.1 spore germination protein (amino acid permease) [Bacillus sp. 3255]
MQNKLGNDLIGILSAFSIIILAVGLMNHVMVIPPLLHEAKRDAWVSVLFAILPYLAWTTLLFYIMRNTDQQPLFTWLTQYYGRVICGAYRLFFILYLFLIIVMTLKETTMWTHTSYLPRTPQWALSISLVLLSCFAAQFGVQSIAITSGILLPFVIIFGDFVMSSNLPQKNYSLLTPVFENGIGPMINGSLYIGGGLVELIVILLFQHQIKKKVPLWSLYLLACFLVLLILGPVTGAIAEFGPFEAGELRYPAYEEWRLVTIGKYIRHVDFLSIYQWLSGAFVRIAISMYLLVELMTMTKQKKNSGVLLALLGIVVVIFVELPISDMQYTAFLKGFYLPGSLWGTTSALVILFALAFFSKREVKRE